MERLEGKMDMLLRRMEELAGMQEKVMKLETAVVSEFVLTNIRIINNSSYNSHTEPIFKSLSILPLTSLIAYFKIQFMFNFVNGELPGSFKSTWIRNEN